MNGETFTQIVLGIILIIGALFAAYVCPYIKSKMTLRQLDMICCFTEMAVRCAEQMFPAEKKEEKKAFVVRKITELINDKGLPLKEDQIDMIIEGIVNEVKKC